LAEALIGKGLPDLSVSKKEFQAMKKNDVRKQALAWLLESRTTMSNAWICARLHMGHWSNLSRAFRRFENPEDRETDGLKTKMLKCTD